MSWMGWSMTLTMTATSCPSEKRLAPCQQTSALTSLSLVPVVLLVVRRATLKSRIRHPSTKSKLLTKLRTGAGTVYTIIDLLSFSLASADVTLTVSETAGHQTIAEVCRHHGLPLTTPLEDWEQAYINWSFLVLICH